ncbi:major capsid protein [Egicoccus halophilus]|uniref:Uncharacterized protein n=1 Tax=Egicoccus halophilus TaxID=1670830 RepID=A0A8J3ET11_9ACTN|nr:major capsid protein [Egicoccus halophilus]GGI02810.1 hypothetical protein GCM10011354_01620 [Egicoccus halophilus]
MKLSFAQLRAALSALADAGTLSPDLVDLVDGARDGDLSNLPAGDLSRLDAELSAAFDELVPEDAPEAADLDIATVCASAVETVRAASERRAADARQLVASVRGPDAPSTPRRPSLADAARHARNGVRVPHGSRARALMAAGEPLDADGVTTALVAAGRDLLRGRGDGGTVVTLEADYPEDRRLTGEPEHDTAVVASVVGTDALVAAGGLCAPLEAHYDLGVWSTAARPLRAALPAFDTSRGGIRFTRGASLADAAAGVTVWTEAHDVDPDAGAGAEPPTGPATKNVWRIECPEEVEVRVDAVVERLRVGNFARMLQPEQVQQALTLLEAAAARTAEAKLLDTIVDDATVVAAAQVLGASRDLLSAVDLAAAGYRSRNRLSDEAVLRVALPSWTRHLLRVDLARQLPGDSTTAVSDAQLAEHFSVRGVSPVWVLDAQVFGAQAAGPLVPFPETVRATLWAEGTYVLLDGGMLHLGWTRDHELNAVNDAELFREVFENVARVAPLTPLAIDVPVDPNGTTSGTVDLVTSA